MHRFIVIILLLLTSLSFAGISQKFDSISVGTTGSPFSVDTQGYVHGRSTAIPWSMIDTTGATFSGATAIGLINGLRLTFTLTSSTTGWFLSLSVVSVNGSAFGSSSVGFAVTAGIATALANGIYGNFSTYNSMTAARALIANAAIEASHSTTSDFALWAASAYLASTANYAAVAGSVISQLVYAEDTATVTGVFDWNLGGNFAQSTATTHNGVFFNATSIDGFQSTTYFVSSTLATRFYFDLGTTVPASGIPFMNYALSTTGGTYFTITPSYDSTIIYDLPFGQSGFIGIPSSQTTSWQPISIGSITGYVLRISIGDADGLGTRPSFDAVSAYWRYPTNASSTIAVEYANNAGHLAGFDPSEYAKKDSLNTFTGSSNIFNNLLYGGTVVSPNLNISNQTTWSLYSSNVFRDVTSIHVAFNYGFGQETACFFGSEGAYNSNKVFIWNIAQGNYSATAWNCRTTAIARNTTDTATASGGHNADWWSKTTTMYYFGMGTVWVSPNFATTDGTKVCIDASYPLARSGSCLIDGDIMWVTLHTGATDLSLYTTGNGTAYGLVTTWANFASNQYQMEYGYTIQKKWGTIYVACETTLIAYYKINSRTIGYIQPPIATAFVTSLQSTPEGLYFTAEYGGQNVGPGCSGGSDLFLYDGNTSWLKANLQGRCGTADSLFLYSERVSYYSNGKLYTSYESGGIDVGTTYAHSYDGQVLRKEMEASTFGNLTGGKVETWLNNRGVLLAPHYKPIGYILVKSDSVADGMSRQIAKETGGLSYPIEGGQVSKVPSASTTDTIIPGNYNQATVGQSYNAATAATLNGWDTTKNLNLPSLSTQSVNGSTVANLTTGYSTLAGTANAIVNGLSPTFTFAKDSGHQSIGTDSATVQYTAPTFAGGTATLTTKVTAPTMTSVTTGFDINTAAFSHTSTTNAVSTNYTNGNRRRMVVIVVTVEPNDGVNPTAVASFCTDPQTTPTTITGKFGGFDGAPNLGGDSWTGTITTVVQPNDKYRLNVTGTVTLVSWHEYDM